jgi:hypothetical protein
LDDRVQETSLPWRLDFFSDIDGIFIHSPLTLKSVFPGRNIGAKIKTREIIEEKTKG